MYILVIELCLFGARAHGGVRSQPSLWSLAENHKAKAHALLTAKRTYFHGFLAFTDENKAVKYKLCI